MKKLIITLLIIFCCIASTYSTDKECADILKKRNEYRRSVSTSELLTDKKYKEIKEEWKNKCRKTASTFELLSDKECKNILKERNACRNKQYTYQKDGCYAHYYPLIAVCFGREGIELPSSVVTEVSATTCFINSL